MDTIPIQGTVGGDHRLSANVPDSIPPGPVKIWLQPVPVEVDSAGDAWAAGVTAEWADELADTNQDIYTLADGDALD